jgi:hypothetical protein
MALKICLNLNTHLTSLLRAKESSIQDHRSNYLVRLIHKMNCLKLIQLRLN